MKNPQKHQLIILITFVIFLLSASASQAESNRGDTAYLPVVHNQPYTGITNPGFESGIKGWVVQSNQGDQVISSGKAHSGSHSAALGNGTNNRVTSIAQQVKVPLDAYGVQYFQWVESLELCNSNNNVVRIFIGTHNYGHYNICQDSDNGKWVEKNIYLYSYRGQTVVFRLEFESSTILGNYLYVDDFSFQVP